MIFLKSKSDFIKSINENKLDIEKTLDKITKETDFARKIKLTYQAVEQLTNSSSAYYSSDVVESVFCTLARQHQIQLNKDYKKNSVLHIASQVYSWGGHSRVIERWIELSDNSEIHSLLLTKKIKRGLPKNLMNLVKEKNGEIFELGNASDLEKGLELRQIASKFDKIILHIHMDDVIPLIAFGTNDFSRPIFLFNHADHRFWLGVSIADCIINFREFGERISLNLRGGSKNFTLPLPNPEKEILTNKNIDALKQELGLPLDKKIIFTSGFNDKYKPLLHYDFVNYMQNILSKRDDIYFIAIGPNKIENQDKLVKDKSKILGEMPYCEFIKYLFCANLVVDSFPMSGATALLDALRLNKPILSLKCPTGQADYLEKSEAYCQNLEELIRKTNLLLTNQEEANKNIAQVLELLNQENSKEIWLSKKSELYEKYTTHKIQNFKSIAKKEPDDLDFYLEQQSLNLKVKLHIPHILTVYKYRKYGKAHLKLALFE